MQAILILEFATNILLLHSILHFSLSIVNYQLSIVFFSFALPVIVWLIIKPLLIIKQKAKQDFRSLQRIKFNTDIFNTLLEKQKRINESTKGLGIMLGNRNAANTLIKVCNPYCGPCAKAHPEIEKLLEIIDDLKVQIIFTATNDEDDIKAPPVKHLLAIAENNDEVKTKQALNDWYLADKKDYRIFSAKYPLNGELNNQSAKIEDMKNWCNEMSIQFTPCFFLNGYQLPEIYSVDELKYFLWG